MVGCRFASHPCGLFCFAFFSSCFIPEDSFIPCYIVVGLVINDMKLPMKFCKNYELHGLANQPEEFSLSCECQSNTVDVPFSVACPRKRNLKPVNEI